jgi:hypothetical protein
LTDKSPEEREKLFKLLAQAITTLKDGQPSRYRIQGYNSVFESFSVSEIENAVNEICSTHDKMPNPQELSSLIRRLNRADSLSSWAKELASLGLSKCDIFNRVFEAQKSLALIQTKAQLPAPPTREQIAEIIATTADMPYREYTFFLARCVEHCNAESEDGFKPLSHYRYPTCEDAHNWREGLKRSDAGIQSAGGVLQYIKELTRNKKIDAKGGDTQ